MKDRPSNSNSGIIEALWRKIWESKETNGDEEELERPVGMNSF